MAQRSRRDDEKQALIEQIEASRTRFSHDAAALASAVDVPARIRRSISDNPLKLATGATIAGLAAAAILSRGGGGGRRRGVTRSLLSPLAGFALELARRRFAKPKAQPPPQKPLAERFAKALWESLK